uniref:Leucine-rich repeats and IQ motif containing 3 n=1 Tax=Electrophorus electricus TaxID=8005 RepID=A0A4W4FUL8_ELEEL
SYNQPTDLQEVVLVTLSSLMLKSLDQLGGCKALRICILADNFLTRIDPLVECVHLVKLDLRGNQVGMFCVLCQIVCLPGSSFWSNLKDLQVLNLHDNNMVSKKNITGLSGCPRLSALTLYDTPLSLKVSYRHCVINSIWTLKALDNHVISDEEIMEDWHLPSKFRAKAPQFCVNLYPQLKLDSYKNEIKVVHGIMAEINRIQAIYSPVLIIQKWIRGSLVRKLISASTPASPPSLGIARRSWIQEHQDGQLHQVSLNICFLFQFPHISDLESLFSVTISL